MQDWKRQLGIKSNSDPTSNEEVTTLPALPSSVSVQTHSCATQSHLFLSCRTSSSTGDACTCVVQLHHVQSSCSAHQYRHSFQQQEHVSLHRASSSALQQQQQQQHRLACSKALPRRQLLLKRDASLEKILRCALIRPDAADCGFLFISPYSSSLRPQNVAFPADNITAVLVPPQTFACMRVSHILYAHASANICMHECLPHSVCHTATLRLRLLTDRIHVCCTSLWI